MTAKPLRICHVVYSFYETDNRVIRYAETLAARGDHVDVIALRKVGQHSRGALNGVNIHRIQRRAINEKAPFAYLLKLTWFFVKCLLLLSLRGPRSYNVIHVHNVPDFLVFTTIVPKMLGARVILDIHDVVPELYAAKFGVSRRSFLFHSLLFVEQLSCRLADHVLVANHLWYEKLIRRSVPAKKCTPILNYPDLSVFYPRRPHESRRPGNSFLFLYPGTLNRHQGLDVAVNAFAQACPSMPGAEFHIYGDGPTRQALRQQVDALGVSERVKIMDRVPFHEVPRLMASANVGVVPKRAEGFGNEAFSTKTLEFMACGVPLILSRTKVDSYYFSPDIVRFFSPGDASDLARSMRWAYDHRGQHLAQISRAHEFARSNSWQEHTREYVNVVDGLTDLSPQVTPLRV